MGDVAGLREITGGQHSREWGKGLETTSAGAEFQEKIMIICPLKRERERRCDFAAIKENRKEKSKTCSLFD